MQYAIHGYDLGCGSVSSCAHHKLAVSFLSMITSTNVKVVYVILFRILFIGQLHDAYSNGAWKP